MLTGLSWAGFTFLVPNVSHGRSTRSDSLPFREQCFLTLVKLRQNIPFEFLAEVKIIPNSTAVKIFLEMDRANVFEMNFYGTVPGSEDYLSNYTLNI